MADLLLAGPILRRVTTELVCVWLATDKKLSFRLKILQGTKYIGISNTTKIEQQRCQLGRNLFVYLLQARPTTDNKTFPLDTLLAYQLYKVSDHDEEESEINLKALELTYRGDANPSFFIPTHLKRLLHGSCRKPHGLLKGDKNNSDALSFGDTLLASYPIDDLENRPALLLLTGDQIYADDVADPIFAMIKQKTVKLLGFQEMLPKKEGEKFDPSTVPVGGRETLSKHIAGFSSGESKNHLFTFAEFAAMYVYVFGNARHWQLVVLPEYDSNLRAALEKFHKTLPNVRRLLANIPTYMIFDDHDVTDDWNITGAWYDKVRDSPLGHRVVSNALAAYWAFQGWGNEPDNFDYDMVRSIIDYLETAQPSDNLERQYDLTSWKHRGWSYSVPTNPPIIFIDSRTQRQPDGNFYPTQLLDRYALDWLRMEWNKLKVEKEKDIAKGIINSLPEWPVFVATTPVMGFAPIEGLLQLCLWFFGTLEEIFFLFEKLFRAEGIVTRKFINKCDVEYWISNRDGFGNFMNCLLHRMTISQCVFLSGDVHYSFTADTYFNSRGKQLHCWQLTSSSLCNHPNKPQRNIISRIAKNEGHASHNNQWVYNNNQRWKTEIQYISESGTENSRLTAQCNIGLVEFSEGKPFKHILFEDGQYLEFLLDSN